MKIMIDTSALYAWMDGTVPLTYCSCRCKYLNEARSI